MNTTKKEFDISKYIEQANLSPKQVSERIQKIAAKKATSKEQIALQKYQEMFLIPPKITDRKTVYLSCETRDKIDKIVRKLGMRGASVSGFIENMAKNHLKQYESKLSQWKKL